jgi:hypothetical protein
MPGNRKPRKKYRPRAVVRPLNMRNAWSIEGAAHAALLALEGGTFCEDHAVDLATHAEVVRRIAGEGSHVHVQATTILRMCHAAQLRGTWQMLPLEEVAIRAACKVTLPFVRQASNHAILRAAESALSDVGKTGGIRI